MLPESINSGCITGLPFFVSIFFYPMIIRKDAVMKSEKYLLALDQGTTSSRCIVFDRDGRVLSVAQKEFTQYYPRAGWVEHNAAEIFDSQLTVAREAMDAAAISPDGIAAIGITNQRETTVVWDKATGEPICPAIVWQCRRTADFCEKLSQDADVLQTVKSKTGLVIDAYFSATKLKWILDNVDGARTRAERGELLFGTVDCYLIWKLTGGKVHATDVSNASRTMLFNINTLEWDDELLKLFDIPSAMLPNVVPSSGIIGYTSALGGSIPIAGVAGDQQAALFGQGCLESGDAKNTYGTGGFLLVNTGSVPCHSENGLLATVGWKLSDGTVRYALEGSTFICGAAIQWLRDGLGIISSAAESEELARSIPDNGGVYLVPAFVGLGAPWWDANARGTIFGLTRGTTRAHVVRAALEAMAYQTYDLLETVKRDTGLGIGSVLVDGGAAKNNFLLSFQADVCGINVLRPECVEATALGAAKLAGLGVGFYTDVKDAARKGSKVDEFKPAMDAATRKSLIDAWHNAIGRTRSQNTI